MQCINVTQKCTNNVIESKLFLKKSFNGILFFQQNNLAIMQMIVHIFSNFNLKNK